MRHRLDPPTDYLDVSGTVSRGRNNAVRLGRHAGTNDVDLGGTTNASRQQLEVTVHDPTRFFGKVFEETLSANGITVGQVVIDRTVRETVAGRWGSGHGWRLAAVHQTPMETILARTNEDSINLYAESLLKRLDHHLTGRSGSWSGGEAAVKQYLDAIGVPSDGIALDDGSGMSRLNRVTATALVGAMAERMASEDADAFVDSLAEAGVEGTLRSRFGVGDRADLRGRVFAKTGYIRGVSTMSGLLRGRDGRWHAFSILINDVPGDGLGRAKFLQEDVVLALDRATAPANATR
jgi:D-alanyl-D-alanine carboxypeptidase/D-alanyl-D-alanine-endopeptidase (penicillin-binding protein 4)